MRSKPGSTGHLPPSRASASALLLALATTISLMTSPITAAPRDLVSLWAAEGTADDAAGTNHGSIHGAVTYVAGKVGQAFAFDGTGGYVEMADNPSLQLIQENTIAAWLYLVALPSDTGFNYIAGRSQGGNDFDIQAEPDNRVRFYPCGGSGGGGYPGSTTMLQTGVWYHVAATYKAAERMELFINGIKEVSIPLSCIQVSHSAPFTIGFSPVWGRPWRGRIDQVRLYSRALSTPEVENLYASETGGIPEPTLEIRVSQVELCWDSSVGVSYQLQYRSDLTTNFWVPVFTNYLRGNGGVLCTNDVVWPDQPRAFYRLVTTNSSSP